jgi:hypothetical protein
MSTMSPLKPISGERVWLGSEMVKSRSEWTYHLNYTDIVEIEAAVESVIADGLDILNINTENFPLPTFGNTLDCVRHDLLEGRGFAVVRGLPVSRYDRLQIAVAYFGIGAHLGEAVAQNAKGHALGHVCDLSIGDSLWTVPTARGYQTAEELIFHTDPPDLVGLLCLHPAKSGGLSRIASTGMIFNQILHFRPDLLEILTEITYRDRRGEIPDGRKPWYRLPVFNFHDGHLLTNYVRSVIQKAQRFPEVPRLTDKQIEAFDFLDETVGDTSLYLELEFEPGDIQLLCNHYIMHSRTAYEDHPEPERRRHLLRLWLAADDAPPLPSQYDEFMGKTASGRPNGYQIAGAELTTPLEVEYGGPETSRQ